MKINLLLFPILFCCFFQCNTAFSQSKSFKEGYIILTSGDTIHGKIKQSSLQAHAEYVIFKEKNSNEQKKYYPNQLSKYYFDDLNYFEANSIPFRNSSGGLDYKELFLKKLVDGDVELFRLDYIIEESPTIYFDYQSTFYFVRVKPNNTLVDLKEDDFKIKLKRLFQNQECQFSKKNNQFNDHGLTTLILDYSNCNGKRSKLTYLPKEKEKISWGISLGYTRPDIKLAVPSADLREFINGDGTGYDFNIFLTSKINAWLAYRAGLNYQHRTQNSAATYTVSEFYDNEGEVLNLESKVTLSHLIVPFHLILNKRINNINLYGLAGVYGGVNASNSLYVDKVNFSFINNESIQFKERENIEDIHLTNYELGWLIGGGAEFLLNNGHSIFAEVQYGNGRNNLNNNSEFFISHQSINFSIGYNFYKNSSKN